MMQFVGVLTEMPCKQKRLTSALVGAAMAYTGVGRNIVGGQMGKFVGPALGGVAVDVACRGREITTGFEELGMSAAIGAAGAIGIQYLVRGSF